MEFRQTNHGCAFPAVRGFREGPVHVWHSVCKLGRPCQGRPLLLPGHSALPFRQVRLRPLGPPFSAPFILVHLRPSPRPYRRESPTRSENASRRLCAQKRIHTVSAILRHPRSPRRGFDPKVKSSVWIRTGSPISFPLTKFRSLGRSSWRLDGWPSGMPRLLRDYFGTSFSRSGICSRYGRVARLA